MLYNCIFGNYDTACGPDKSGKTRQAPPKSPETSSGLALSQERDLTK